jgi:hypothetical protein
MKTLKWKAVKLKYMGLSMASKEMVEDRLVD